MISGAKIGIDLDDTVYQYWQTVRHCAVRYLGSKFGDMPTPTRHGYFEREWGHTKDQYHQLVQRGVQDGILFARFEPHKHCVQVIQKLHKHNEIIFITARSRFYHGRRTESLTHSWLNHHKIPYDSVIFTPQKHEVDIDVLIDDHQTNMIRCQSVGKPFILCDTPMNQELMWNHRMADWRDAPAMLEEVLH